MSEAPFNATDRSGPRVERRRERRYEVELRGELRYGDKGYAVRILDLSASGALVQLAEPPAVGTQVELLIEDFGAVDVEVIHASDNFCGLMLIDSAAYRDLLQQWLRGEVSGHASLNAAG